MFSWITARASLQRRALYFRFVWQIAFAAEPATLPQEDIFMLALLFGWTSINWQSRRHLSACASAKQLLAVLLPKLPWHLHLSDDINALLSTLYAWEIADAAPNLLPANEYDTKTQDILLVGFTFSTVKICTSICYISAIYALLRCTPATSASFL